MYNENGGVKGTNEDQVDGKTSHGHELKDLVNTTHSPASGISAFNSGGCEAVTESLKKRRDVIPKTPQKEIIFPGCFPVRC